MQDICHGQSCCHFPDQGRVELISAKSTFKSNLARLLDIKEVLVALCEEPLKLQLQARWPALAGKVLQSAGDGHEHMIEMKKECTFLLHIGNKKLIQNFLNEIARLCQFVIDCQNYMNFVTFHWVHFDLIEYEDHQSLHHPISPHSPAHFVQCKLLHHHKITEVRRLLLMKSKHRKSLQIN